MFLTFGQKFYTENRCVVLMITYNFEFKMFLAFDPEST